MRRLAKKTWLALALLGALHFTAAAASAAPALTGASVFDGYLGGYIAYLESLPYGSFHLYVIEGNDPNGAIVNDNTPLSLSLSPGTHTFTLLGTEGPTSGLIDYSDLSSLPAVTLTFSEGAASGNLTIAHGAQGSLTLGLNTITVTSFTWTPWDQSSVNRVGTSGVGADPYWDAVGQLTIEVSGGSAGLLGKWPFDEGGGTVAADASGNGHHGDLQGPVWSTGALDFDGIDDYVAVQHDFQIGHAITMAAWIKPDNLDEGRRGGILVHRWNNDGADHIFTTWGSQLHYNVLVDNNWFTFETPVGSLQTGQWQHVAVTVTPDHQVDLYIDGVVQGSGIYWGTSLWSINSPWYIGREAWGVANNEAVFGGPPLHFDGQMKEVALYDRALSAQELDQLRGEPPVEENQPPVADAGPDQTVEGTGSLTSVTLNGAASTDPDGDALIYSWSENSTEISTASTPTLSLAQGLHTFTLTVSDGQGGSAVDEVVVRLVDTTAPTVSAALVAINRGRDDDEDEDGNFYRVAATATDLVDTNPTVSALLTQPLTSGSNLSVSYKREKKNRIKVKTEKRRLQVQLEGPSEPALRALWAQVLANGGFSVSNGQEIQVEVRKDKKEEYEAQYQLDKNLRLTSAKGPGLKLLVWAADAVGNVSARVEVAPGRSGRSDRDDRHAKLVNTLPASFGLEANYPNPFNPSTTLRYHLAEAGQVQLTVYNVMGQQVRVLVDQVQPAGAYQIEWDSRDQAGQDVAPGLYLYRLVSGNQTAIGKMLLVK